LGVFRLGPLPQPSNSCFKQLKLAEIDSIAAKKEERPHVVNLRHMYPLGAGLGDEFACRLAHAGQRPGRDPEQEQHRSSGSV
jgi:hypothetical protein